MKASQITKPSAPRSVRSSGRAATSGVRGTNGATAPKHNGARPAAVTPAKEQAVVMDHAPAKPVKARKVPMVRGSFAVPRAEYALLSEMKLRADRLASPAKKKALLRAGIQALAALPDADFLAALRALPKVKAARPAKAK